MLWPTYAPTSVSRLSPRPPAARPTEPDLTTRLGAAQSLATAAADASFASSIIDAINTAATTSGFGDVVLSTPADVMATITVPDTVSITLPPAP